MLTPTLTEYVNGLPTAILKRFCTRANLPGGKRADCIKDLCTLEDDTLRGIVAADSADYPAEPEAGAVAESAAEPEAPESEPPPPVPDDNGNDAPESHGFAPTRPEKYRARLKVRRIVETSFNGAIVRLNGKEWAGPFKDAVMGHIAETVGAAGLGNDWEWEKVEP